MSVVYDDGSRYGYDYTYCGCDHCVGYSDPPPQPPDRFTRRRMLRARKKYNASVRSEPNAYGQPIHWGTLGSEEQRWHALHNARRNTCQKL